MKKISIIVIFTIITSLMSCALLFAQKKTSDDKEFTVKTGVEVFEAIIKGDFGELEIRKGREDNKGSVFVEYDYDLYDYDYYFDEKFNELFVTLKKESFWEGVDRYDIDQNVAFIDLQLPRKIPTNLDVQFKGGEITMELGGIPLKNFVLDSWAGETIIRFDDRNPEIMEYMKIDVNIGEVNLERLGNANFKEGYIDGGIGELKVDLTGEYEIGDHNLEIDMDIGGAEVILPRDVGVKIHVSKWPLVSVLNMDRKLRKNGKYYYSDNFDDAEKKLFIKMNMGMGECKVIIY
ncbi:MAG: cell wall-active antibiotics response protein [bacterium]|nr:cell wall-active antibiotics response protein [bacterium]